MCCIADYPAVLDHAHVWQDVNGRRYLLAHLYGMTPAKERRVRGYAARHGLTVTIGDPDDDWYGHGTTPVCYEATTTEGA